MMDLGFKIGDKVFVCFLNDDDSKREGFFTIVSISETTLTISTGSSKFLLPMSRVLKIKMKGDDSGWR